MGQMIKSFGDKRTQDFYNGIGSARARRVPADIAQATIEKLDILAAATDLNDLRIPPSNHLEKLKGDLTNFHSIRINRQWRIVFRWAKGDAEDVKLMDYH